MRPLSLAAFSSHVLACSVSHCLFLLAALLLVCPQRSQAQSISVGVSHSCAILSDNTVKCWGNSGGGRTGYDTTTDIGDGAGTAMADLGTVNLGTGRTAKAISVASHTCAILDDNTVKCWGPSSQGRTGYDSTTPIGNGSGTAMSALSTVNLGSGRTAKAISVGDNHTCVILDTDAVKCWGDSQFGKTGYDSTTDIGDGSGTSMAALGTLDLGTDRTTKAIAAGGSHTCVILDTDAVKCWGDSGSGQTGYDTTTDIGDGTGTAMADLGTVNLGSGRTAKAIAAGTTHTCAILDNDTVKCWGNSFSGRTGYDSITTIGNGSGTAMSALGTVNLGTGRTAKAITAGSDYTCAILDNDAVKCWGDGFAGKTGYDSQTDIGDGINTAMADLGTVNLGTGRTALALATGTQHTCAVLDDLSVKCWGDSDNGRTGYDTTTDIGDGSGTTMAALGTVNLGTTALPVELVTFAAILNGTALQLRWTTASETNNAGFHVEHQPPMHAAWQPLAFITGYGTSLETQTYTYDLVTLDPGTHRFRLKQIDFDGTFAYSPEIATTIGVPDAFTLSAPYPNPFNPEASFTLALRSQQHVTITVADALGREVARLHDSVLAANQTHTFALKAAAWASGLYIVRVVGDRFSAHRTVSLLK